MRRVVLATLVLLLFSAVSAPATPIVTVTDDSGVMTTFSGSGNSVNINSGTYGSFRIDSGTISAIAGATANDPNLLTLSNTQITNTGAGNATLVLNYSNIFTNLNMTADRFYGTSMSGGFAAADPLAPATGAFVVLTAVVNYGVSCEPFCLSGTGNIDLNKTFTVSTDNGFAPQNPSQGTATLGCLALAESGCSNPGLEQLSDQVSIFLHPGESISILATIVTLSAGSAEVRDIALAQFLPVPAPSTLILVGAGLLVPGVVGLGRKLRRNG